MLPLRIDYNITKYTSLFVLKWVIFCMYFSYRMSKLLLWATLSLRLCRNDLIIMHWYSFYLYPFNRLLLQFRNYKSNRKNVNRPEYFIFTFVCTLVLCEYSGNWLILNKKYFQITLQWNFSREKLGFAQMSQFTLSRSCSKM